MAYSVDNLKLKFNTIHAISYTNNNYNLSRNTISKDKYSNTNPNQNPNTKKNNSNKNAKNYILLSNPNLMGHIKNNSSRMTQISLSENKIQKSLSGKTKRFRNKKFQKKKLYDAKNTLLESIKESNCDSTTINNNDTNSDEFNYNDLLKELNRSKNINNISENAKNNNNKKPFKKHMKHYSDFVNSMNVLLSNKYNKSNKKNKKIYNSNNKNKNKNKSGNNEKKSLNSENNNKRNIYSIKKKKLNKKKDVNVNYLYDRNNLINDINNYELYIYNNIDNICFNNEQNDIQLESKINNLIVEQLINKKINKHKRAYNKETTFVNNFNSDYSFESDDDFKKNIIGSKINLYPNNNNIFKDISFKSLTNSSESKNEMNGIIMKNKKYNSKINNGLFLNNNNLNMKCYNIKSYNITQDINYNLDNNKYKYKNTDYSGYKKNFKRNISESILKKDEKINDKKHINKIHSIINNKKNNNIINNCKEKKNEYISNESWLKKNNKNNNINKKRFYYTNNGRIIKKSKLKISINDTHLIKIKEKKVNKKTLSNSSIDKITDNNNKNDTKRKNIKLIVYHSSIKNTKNSKEKSHKRDVSSIRKTKIKSKSTPKEMNNYFPYKNYNNISIIHYKKNNKNIFDNNSISLPKKTVNSYSHKNKSQNKSFKKASKKLFIPKIFININKNNNIKKGNKKNKKLSVKIF